MNRVDLAISQCPVAADSTPLVNAAAYVEGVPHALWAELRDTSPVTRQTRLEGGEFWSVTSYREVAQVLRDTTTFTSEQGTLLDLLGRHDSAAGLQLVATDPPRHTTLRPSLQRELAAKPVAAIRDRLRSVVDETLAPLAEGEVYDLAGHLRWLAVAVMGDLMGLPRQDWGRLAELSLASVAPEDQVFGQPEGPERVLTATHRELLAYFHQIVRDRRGKPGDDLISVLIETKWDGYPLNESEIILNCYSLLLGGNVTTSQVPATTLNDLMGTATLDRWVSDPTSLATGVEEALRWSTPNTHFMRYAVRDVELHGQPIKRGDAVVVWLASANRDAKVFPDPDTFDIGRRPNRHLTFGAGAHYCVGNAVVRETLKLFFAELFTRFSDLAPAGPGVRLRSNTIAGWTALPITASLRTQGGAAHWLDRPHL